ncbi:serine carboxypeptidase [Colletotrichum sublineola]|uniref:Carboxypeptidase n=1 Tax=Colletotrichum sublineola TaxID=1173701 RepID=A0A066XK93_COLSU|nr:serine carboxypeptidase [Colletotrichum sublineola]KDN68079.1 putative serine carboxypeptidase [Colletotrichum sublineola]
MKFLSLFYGLLCASSVGAFKRAAKHRPILPRSPPVKRSPVERSVADQPSSHPEPPKRASRFVTDKTNPFAVNSTGFPDVPFDIGESYAGLLPISDDPDETRKLFFWFFPSTAAETPEEVTIWLNGGPGCSSLSGFLTENGVFTWEDGTLAPVQNPYAWTNLTNMLWVEQPVGVGYSQGVPDISNEVELAAEFKGFYKNFVDTFQTNDWKTYITGESYAGYYVPYIADSFISANDPEYFNLAGISINDPLIGDETIQGQVVVMPYVEYWQNLMYLNETFLKKARERQESCNYTSYLDTYFKFPPPQEPFPVLPDPYSSETAECDMFDDVFAALLEVNPCFNIYHITDTCPIPYAHLGIVNQGDYSPPGTQVYFNRTDVKKALHAPLDSNWMQCTDINVFGKGNASSNASDSSPDAVSSGVLQRVIEFTNNTIIGSGDLDMLLNTNGTLFVIQNMTWNGAKGLSEYPNKPLYAPYHPEYNQGALAGAGLQGVWTSERGLTFYTSHLAGHELPGYTPGVGYRMLEILLGKVKDFGSIENFTTQKGNFTDEGTIRKQDE